MILNRTLKLILFFLLSTILLALGFGNNQWKATKANRSFNKPIAHGFILGRLAASRQDGIFAGSGLLGLVGPIPEDTTFTTIQNEAYYNNSSFDTFGTYNSRIGFEGITYSLFDKLTSLSPKKTIIALNLLTATLLALVLSAIILWFYLEFGFICAGVVLITTMFSASLTMYGNSLLCAMWSIYLPFATTLFALKYRNSLTFLLMLIFLSVFVKCLYSGYEVITTTLVMTVTPFIYYSISDGWGLKKFLIRMFAATSTALLSVLSTVLILVYQISTVEGDTKAGFYHIFSNKLILRTYGDPTNLKVGIYELVQKYYYEFIFDFNNLFDTSILFLSITYKKVIIIFLFVSFLIFLLWIYQRTSLNKKTTVNIRKMSALCLTTWFSLLAPLSWFIIFKSHSYLHITLNKITWHMPFILYGFALVGTMIHYLYTDILALSTNKDSPETAEYLKKYD